MPDIDDELAKGAIGEEILSQIKLVLEVVSAQPTRTEFNDLSGKLDDLADEVHTVKAAVLDVSRALRGHDARLLDLETTVEAHDKQLRSLRREAA